MMASIYEEQDSEEDSNLFDCEDDTDENFVTDQMYKILGETF